MGQVGVQAAGRLWTDASPPRCAYYSVRLWQGYEGGDEAASKSLDFT